MSLLRWPGWDGFLLIGLAVLVLGYWASKLGAGGAHWVLLVLALDLTYLGATYWSRRK